MPIKQPGPPIGGPGFELGASLPAAIRGAGSAAGSTSPLIQHDKQLGHAVAVAPLVDHVQKVSDADHTVSGVITLTPLTLSLNFIHPRQSQCEMDYLDLKYIELHSCTPASRIIEIASNIECYLQSQ